MSTRALLIRGPSWRIPTACMALALIVWPPYSPLQEQARDLGLFLYGFTIASANAHGWWRR